MRSPNSSSELALENLRMAVGVNGEIEVGQLGAIGRGFDGALQFVEATPCQRRGLGRLLGALGSVALLRSSPAATTSRGAHQMVPSNIGRGAESGHAAVEV